MSEEIIKNIIFKNSSIGGLQFFQGCSSNLLYIIPERLQHLAHKLLNKTDYVNVSSDQYSFKYW